MKFRNIAVLIILLSSSQIISAQRDDTFTSNYSAYKGYNAEKAREYKDVDGSPYLNKEFIEASLFLKDSSIIKLSLRYNIYTDEMEYQVNEMSYVVSNPEISDKIQLGESTFMFLPLINKGGYYQLLESGKCLLFRKKIIAYKPSEGPKAIVGTEIPASFNKKPDEYYIVLNGNMALKVKNIKNVIATLGNKKTELENFTKKEKIKNIKKDNLARIINYYNRL